MIHLLLKDILRSRNIPSSALAEMLGVTATTVSNWNSGKAFPPAEMLEKISDILGIPVWQLLVSPEEVMSFIKSPDAHRCPHCGGYIEVSTEVKLKPL